MDKKIEHGENQIGPVDGGIQIGAVRLKGLDAGQGGIAQLNDELFAVAGVDSSFNKGFRVREIP